jgi:hypothetical protein
MTTVVRSVLLESLVVMEESVNLVIWGNFKKSLDSPLARIALQGFLRTLG